MSQANRLSESFPRIGTGASESRLKGVCFFKETQHIPRKPLVYDPGICIVVQGHKIGYLSDQEFQYDANNYLITIVTVPFECETFATSDEPLLGLYIDIDMGQLHDLIGRIGLQTQISNADEKIVPSHNSAKQWTST
ncbi:MAG: AraC family transcriptional regulator [Desulfobacterium sp.]